MPRRRLSATHIAGNVLLTPHATWVWFRLPTTSEAFTSQLQREHALLRTAQAWANLVDRDIHLRVTTRSYPVAEWDRRLTREETAFPDESWSPARMRLWNEWIEHQQRVQHHLGSAALASKEVYIGVRLVGRPMSTRVVQQLRRQSPTVQEQDRAAEDAARVRDILTGPGMDGRPASTCELRWLLHRSTALGVSAPEGLETAPEPASHPVHIYTDGLGRFTDDTTVTADRDGRTIQITADRDGVTRTRHVQIRSVGDFGETLEIPPYAPWLAQAEQVGAPVDISAHLRVVSGREEHQRVEQAAKWAANMVKQAHQHDLGHPEDDEARLEHARQVKAEMSTGSVLEATRVRGIVRLAVSGSSAEVARSRGQALADMYQRRQIRVELLPEQAHHSREFIPGEPALNAAHTRRMKVTMAAAAGPTATTRLGDGVGPYLGRAGTRPVMWDPHYGIQSGDEHTGDLSGLTPVMGEQGSGKSAILGWTAYTSALRGIPTMVVDPIGNLAQLARLPELAEHAEHLPLAKAPPGVLNPFSVVSDPPPGADYDRRRAETEAARHVLVRDVLKMLLPTESAEQATNTHYAISEALENLGGEAWHTLDDVLREMSRSNETQARKVSAHLAHYRKLPMARLLFNRPASGDRTPAWLSTKLLIITLEDVMMPNPGVPVESYTTEQQLAVPLLHLVTHLATRRVYGKPMDERATFCLDEAHFLSQWPAGKALFHRLGHDTRRWTTRVMAASQKPEELLDLNVEGLVGEAFAGHISDPQVAGNALRLLRAPVGAGYEQHLARLPLGQGRYVMRDAYGHVDQLQVDLAHHPSLLQALTSTSQRYETEKAGV